MKTRKWLIIFLIIIVPAITGCQSSSPVRQKKQLEKREAKRTKEAEKQYNAAVEKHYKMQSKDTKKRMKTTARKSQKTTPGYKKSFFQRIFGKKDKSCPVAK